MLAYLRKQNDRLDAERKRDEYRPLQQTLHPAQERIMAEAKRFNVLACGRRFGKTTLLLHVAKRVVNAGHPFGWFSPTYKLLTEVWREAHRDLVDSALRVSSQGHRLELESGGIFEMWSLDAPQAAGRGRKYKAIAIDEAALVPGLEEAWEASIRPTLTDLRGEAWFGSTPQGRNYFHTLYKRGTDELHPEWASWQMPTTENPYIDAEEIAEAERGSPSDIFRQEYLAEFLESEGVVFRNIAACLYRPESMNGTNGHAGHRVVMGVDFAQLQDWTAMSVYCVDCTREIFLDRFNQINWELQLGRIVATYHKWHVKELLVESNSIGGPLLEILASDELLNVRGFETTAVSKPPLIQSLALAFERAEAKWIDVPWATEELKAFEVHVNSYTGRPTFSAPEGQHDDTVIARAIAFWAACHPAGMFGISTFER